MKKILLAILVLFIISVGAWYFHQYQENTEELRIFHAGSLTGLVNDLSVAIKESYGISILNEPSGSIDVIRKIIDLNKSADIVMVSDYRLIPELMFTENAASWVLAFASNEMVIAYTNSSKYSNEINRESWLDIILRPDVRIGFADPNKDPCGYRACMVLGLASLALKTTLPLEVLRKYAGINYELGDGSVVLDSSRGVKPDAKKIFIRDKSVDLIALLESGALDYAFEYKNLAISHNLNYVSLPAKLNLADPNLDNWYSSVEIKVSGVSNEVRTLKAESIAYGLTIPSNSRNIDNAKAFIKLLLSDKGKNLLIKNGFKPLDNPIVKGNVPNWLEEIIRGGD